MNFKKKPQDASDTSVDKPEEKSKRKREIAEQAFAVDVILNTFTEEEIRNGVFPGKKSLSKKNTRVPIEPARINELKSRFFY